MSALGGKADMECFSADAAIAGEALSWARASSSRAWIAK